MAEQHMIPGWVGILLATLCLLFALRAGRRRRLIDNIPTTKTTGVFIGLVELQGSAESERPLNSFLAQTPCVYYSWNVAERWSRTVTESYTDSNEKTRTRTRHESGWTTVAGDCQQMPFYLCDEEGTVLVRPQGAKIEPAEVFEETCGLSDPLYYEKGPARAVSDSDHRRCFTEQAIHLHAPIYLIGRAREREDIIAPEIAHDPSAPMFLISTRAEAKVSSGLNWQYWILAILGLALSVAGWLIALNLQDRIRDDVWNTCVYVGLGYLLVWLLAWAWMVHNSMVNVRSRVRQAWANVDVQLKRRADLIPNLLHVVEGLRDHEHRVHTEVARLRNQQHSTAPGQSGSDPEGVSKCLFAVLERYPELKSNTVFLGLQRSLIETEQRIALARTYFNDIATHYNIRLKIIPDRFVSTIIAMRARPLLSTTGFERAPVNIEFAK